MEGLRDAHVAFTCGCQVEQGNGHRGTVVDQQRGARAMDRSASVQHIFLDGDLGHHATLGSLWFLHLGYDGYFCPYDPRGDFGLESARASGFVEFGVGADEVDEGLFECLGSISRDGGGVDPFAGVHLDLGVGGRVG